MEDFLLDPEFEFELVEPKGTTIHDTVAKIKVNEVLKRSNLTQIGSLGEVLKYKSAFKWSLIPLRAKSKKPRIRPKYFEGVTQLTDRAANQFQVAACRPVLFELVRGLANPVDQISGARRWR